jgi:serine/threonine protein phosphatase PrpC
MLQVRMASRSETGGRSRNEDDLRYGASGSFWYAVLADGAGGHRSGAEASDRVVRAMSLGLQSATQATPDFLTLLVNRTHMELGQQQQGQRGTDRMHATLVALWIDARRGQALWTHVGDSRLYRLRHGRVCGVTADDSAVQHMLNAGYLSPEEARNHPRRHQLLSALGTAEPVRPHTLPAPATVQDGDAFLLCSDGWWEGHDHAAIEQAFAAATSPQEWLDLMAQPLQAALHPRQDNYSAVAVWLGAPEQTTRAAPL